MWQINGIFIVLFIFISFRGLRFKVLGLLKNLLEMLVALEPFQLRGRIFQEFICKCHVVHLHLAAKFYI